MAEPFVIARTAAGNDVEFLPSLANRHGLVTGATGTGKTVTLQVLTDHFSQIGVPVFVADVKGDLSGVAAAGAMSPKLAKRLKATCSGTCSASVAFRSARQFRISDRSPMWSAPPFASRPGRSTATASRRSIASRRTKSCRPGQDRQQGSHGQDGRTGQDSSERHVDPL